MPFSPRLRRLVIRSIGLIGYKVFEGVGVERFIGLLNYLHVTVKNMGDLSERGKPLLEALQASEGTRWLSHRYWELLVELVISELFWPGGDEILCSPQTTTFLTEAQEWSKLKRWMGIVWMLWPLGTGGMTEGDLDRSMVLLFCQRPGAFQKLEEWMERWNQKPERTHSGRFNEFATKHRKRHNGMHRKFTFALTERILSLTWEF